MKTKLINKVQKYLDGKDLKYISSPIKELKKKLIAEKKGIPYTPEVLEGRVAEVAEEVLNARDFLINWNNARKATGRFDDLLLDIDYMNNRIANAVVAVTPNHTSSGGVFNAANKEAAGVAKVYSYPEKFDPSTTPYYARNLSNNILHELAHAGSLYSTAKKYFSGNASILDVNNVLENDVTNPVKKVNSILGNYLMPAGGLYENTSAEVYARLQTMRRVAQMDPTRTYSYDDMKYWLKLFDLDYGREKSEALMNDVALNLFEDLREHKTFFAKKGSKLINKYLDGGVNRPEQKLPKDAKMMADWLDDWNEKAYATGKFNDLLGNGEMEKLAARRRSVIFTDSPAKFGHLFALNAWGKSRKEPGFMDFYKEKSEFARNSASKEGVQGLYHPETHVAYATRFAPYSDDAQREEVTHASLARPLEAKIAEIIGTPKDPYLDDESEIYYRVMLFRKDNNMDPTKRDYTIEDVEKMRKPFEVEKFYLHGVPRKDGKGLTLYSTEVEDKNYELFNRYSTEQLMRIFNEVADAGTQKQPLTYFAKQGNKLIKQSDRK